MPPRAALLLLLLVLSLLPACAPRPGAELHRRGDEIMIAGRLFHTGAPVVLWSDPGGYDAYRTDKRFAPWPQAQWKPKTEGGPASGHPETPARYGIRFAASPAGAGLTDEEFDRARAGDWPLELLQQHVDQFVLHYDVCGTSRTCFRILHDVRGLSVHFMLDIDGTIYQTLDVKERAWHATTSNDRSVGIEIANIGAYPAPSPTDTGLPKPLEDWYDPDPAHPDRTILTIPPLYGDGGIRTPNFTGRPRRGLIRGEIQGRDLVQYDLTREQYDSLIRLTATLCTVLPRIECDYPRDEQRNLIREKLPDDALASYRGLIGHWHIQDNKTDPGPALDWDYVTTEARRLMRPRP